MVSRGTRRGRTPVVRRKWVWARRLIQGAAVGANAAVFSDLLADFQTAFGADALGVTIMRIRGVFSVVGPTLMIAGARVMTQSDFATMVSPAQGPAADPYADWMLYEPMVNLAGSPAGVPWGFKVDTQASRKLEELGQGLLLSVSNPTATAGTFDCDLSIGLKLP